MLHVCEEIIKSMSDRAVRHPPSSSRPVSAPYPRWLSVSVFLKDAITAAAETPLDSGPPRQGLCNQAPKEALKLTELLKAFFFLSFFHHIFFCSAAAQSLSHSFLTLPYTEITSAWPRGDIVSILFLINLTHWQSLLNNKALPPLFFQRGDIFISVRRSDLGFTPDLDFSFARLSITI